MRLVGWYPSALLKRDSATRRSWVALANGRPSKKGSMKGDMAISLRCTQKNGGGSLFNTVTVSAQKPHASSILRRLPSVTPGIVALHRQLILHE